MKESKYFMLIVVVAGLLVVVGAGFYLKIIPTDFLKGSKQGPEVSEEQVKLPREPIEQKTSENLEDAKEEIAESFGESERDEITEEEVEAEGEKLSKKVPAALAKIQINTLRAEEGGQSFSISIQCVVRQKKRSWHVGYEYCVIDADKAKDYISVSPNLKYAVVSARNKFTLVGNFRPKATYAITINSGLPSDSAYILGKQVNETVEIPDFKPSLTFLGNARYLPKLENAAISFESRNVEKTTVQFEKVFKQNLIYWLTKDTEETPADIGDQVHKKVVKINSSQNKKFKGRIKLDEIAKLGKGVYAITANLKKKDDLNRLDRAVIVVTDIAVIAKWEQDDIHVWTRSLDDLSAKNGVEVKVYSYNNQKLMSCTTGGEQSDCVLRGVMRSKSQPYAMILETTDDFTYMRFSDLEIYDASKSTNLRPFRVNSDVDLHAFIYSSRGVYRPGETVNLAAVVRNLEYQPAEKMPIKWKITDPRSNVQRELMQTTSELGFLTYNYETANFSPTGQYNAQLLSGDKQIASYDFFVEEFVPERIGVKFKAEREQIVGVKEAAKFVIDAKYLFGPPVAKGEFTFRCNLARAWTTIPGHPDFSVGVVELENEYKLINIEEKKGYLDDNGIASVDCDYKQHVDGFPTVMRLSADSEVREAGSGRVTFRNANMLASKAEVVLGIKQTKKDNLKKVSIEAKYFDLEGKSASVNRKVKLDFYRLQHDWFYSYDEYYSYSRWQQTTYLLPEELNKVVETKNGRLSASFNLKRSWGTYIVRATDMQSGFVSDRKINVGYSWYWSGPESTGQLAPPSSPDSLIVKLDKREAVNGGTVTASIESPYAGHLLFTLETDRVVSSEWHKVKKGGYSVKFKVPMDLNSNVYVSMLVLKNPNEKSMYVPGRAWGSKSLKIKPVEETLDMEIIAKDIIRPRGKFEFEVKVKNNEQTELTVAVVDQGVLQLTNFSSPDPLKYFFAERRLGVATYETVGWTFSRHFSSPRTQGGGANGGDEQGREMPVRIVSYWAGMLKTDANGIAKVSLDIPPFQGKVRIMVSGVSKTKFGGAEKYVTVRDPLVVQPTFPRFLSYKDKVKIPVFLVNMTGKPQTIDVTLKTSNSLKVKDPSKQVTLADKASKTVRFDVQVDRYSGDAEFIVEAKAENIFVTDNATIPIQPYGPKHRILTAKKANEVVTAKELIPDNFVTDGLQMEATVSNMPYLKALTSLSYLVRYPYGCIEQTTSSTFPLLAIGEILPYVDSEKAKDVDLQDMIHSGIDRVASMQTGSGGFGYWPGASSPVLWGTVYATHMLLSAKSLGFDVSARTITRAIDYIESEIQNRTRENARLERRVEPYALYVLSLAGKHQKGRLRQLANSPPSEWGNLATENKFLVMAALHRAGEIKLATQLRKKRYMFEASTAKGRDYYESYWSPQRTDAMRLAFAEDLWPGSSEADPLARRVSNFLRGKSYSTQEVAWGILGLGKRSKALKVKGLRNVALKVNGKKIAPTGKTGEIPFWRFADPKNRKFEFSFETTNGKVPLAYYTISGYLKGNSKTTSAENELSLKRSYLTLEGGKANLKKIKQGQLIVIKLSINNSKWRKIENVAIVDRIPAGFEIENPRLGRGQNLDWLSTSTLFSPDYIDMRDSQLQIFGNVERTRKGRYFYYVVRAVTAGEFIAPPAKIEAMYDPVQYMFTKPVNVVIKGTGI